MSAAHRLTPLLAPRSIAFVGASRQPDTVGNDMLRMIRRSGFDGAVYAVNPRYDEVEGYPCFPSLAALPGPVDHAVLSVANARLEATLAEAIAAGTRAATIFASCYLEHDREPPLLARLAAMARAAGMPICGGNCMGFYNDAARVWICGFPSPREPGAGPIALISHSGSSFGALAHNDRRFRFNLVVSPGQELVTSAADYLDYALDQDGTRAVGMFLEAVRDPPAFVAALAKAQERCIPVVVLKVGRTAESAALAVTHSGALAGNDAAYQALFDRHGVLRVDTLDELATTLLFFAQGRQAAAGGIATIGDSGGEREMHVDLAAELGIPFARIDAATKAKLAARLDFGLEPHNPLDAWGTGKDFVDIFGDCFTALLDDPDTALGVFFGDIRDNYYISEGFANACIAAAARTQKPVALAPNYTGVRHDALVETLRAAGVPVLDGTVPALLAARHLLAYRDFLARPPLAPPSLDPARRARWRARLAAPRAVDEAEGLVLLAEYGIGTPIAWVVASAAEACAVAATLGRAVALKTAMPGIAHKSDVGGVRLGLEGEAAIRAAYDDLAARLGPCVIVQDMAPKGVELALGVIADPQFGPVVMIGAGGVLVELLRDVRYALAPFDAATAMRLLDGLKLRPLLDGVRGAPPVDRAWLAETIARFSLLAAELGDLLAGLDVNPLIATPDGAIAVDALVIAKPKDG